MDCDHNLRYITIYNSCLFLAYIGKRCLFCALHTL